MTNPNKPLDTMTQLDLSSLFSGSLLYDKFVAISHSLTNKKIDSFTTKSIYNSPKRDREKKQSIFTNNIAPKTKSISKFKLSHQAVVGKLSNVRDFSVYAVFTTKKDASGKTLYDGSIRSKKNRINDIAEKFGGGGHACAAGVKNLTQENMTNILNLLRKRI